MIKAMLKSAILKNSFWAISSSVFQNIVFAVFFIIMARMYNTQEFSSYIIANTLYGLLLSFSSLGMAQWYIRAIKNLNEHQTVNRLYFTIQLMAGVLFLLLNVLISFLLYADSVIHILSIILGLNIVVDNMINVFKTINIATFNQRQSFMILSIEACLKLTIALLVYYLIPNIVVIALLLVFLRVITFALFYFSGDFKKIFQGITIIKAETYRQVITTIFENRFFLFIGSISVLFWSLGSILVSKFLDTKAVADYEIAYKLSIMAEIIPLMILNSSFPKIVEYVNRPTIANISFLKALSYSNILYGLLAYSFVISFSDVFVPFFFGIQYAQTAQYCNEMFLTMLLFPSVLFQANLLVAIKMEKTDMYLNLLSLFINLFIAGLGLMLHYSLSSITYSIFISFLVFHLSQEYFLIKKGLSQIGDVVVMYLIIFGGMTGYLLLMKYVEVVYLFPLIWIVVFILIIPSYKRYFVKA
jgi:O-antigen/teichoic acid export membrane protein